MSEVVGQINLLEILPELTTHQRRVIGLLLEGKTNKEAAKQLGVSPRTVEDHRSGAIMRTKCGNIMKLAHRVHGSPTIVP